MSVLCGLGCLHLAYEKKVKIIKKRVQTWNPVLTLKLLIFRVKPMKYLSHLVWGGYCLFSVTTLRLMKNCRIKISYICRLNNIHMLLFGGKLSKNKTYVLYTWHNLNIRLGQHLYYLTSKSNALSIF